MGPRRIHRLSTTRSSGRDAGILFVASAGNDSQEISTLPEYPAAYALDNIVAVASTTRQDRLASYSTYGSGLVELAAPGSSVLSLGITSPTSYATLSGTSMAAPHVSGAFALLKQQFPGDTYRGLINRLLSSVDILPDLDHRVHTNGRLNLLRALQSTDVRPFNDNFARRAVLTGTTSVVRSSNHGATREAAEPDHGAPASGGSLWWSWTPPEGTGTVTVTTAGSGVDTVLAVYRAPADATLANLVRVGFNDDAGTAVTSSVTFDVTPGETYAIAVAGKGATDGLVLVNLLSIPVNDVFAAARVLSGPSVVIAGNNNNATSQTGEPRVKNAAGSNAAVGKTLWYRWTAPETHTYQISTDGATMDPVTAIFTGTAFNNLAQVAFDDDSGPGRDSLIRFSAIAGVTYHICVDSFSASGRFNLSIADAAWQYVSEDEFFASPAVGPDGTLYAVDYFGAIHALTQEGVRRWRSLSTTLFVTNGAIAVGRDGTLYAADDLGAVFALDPATGAKKWMFETDGAIWAAPAIAADGTIYIKSDDELLYALNPDGTLKWKVEMPGDTYAAPALGADGTIYIGSGKNSALHAINPDGTPKWQTPLGATVYGSPAIGADGTIYLGNYDGRIFAFNPNGTERWRFDTLSPLSSSPILDARGTLYIGSYDKKLYALDTATGTKRWDYATGDIIRSTSAVLADDGTIYIGSDDCLVHALNPDGTLKRTYATTGPIHAAPILYAGRLLVASSDGKVYAFDTGNNLATSPWPMHRHNVRRIARAAVVEGTPVFATQPVAPANVTAGSAVSIPCLATLSGAGNISYQWYFNNVAMAGATQATLQIASAQGVSAGDYRVVASGPGGAVTSRATTLAVAAVATDRARLVNLAVRTSLTAADRVLFVGFSIGGAGTTGAKPLLIRAVGPTLAAFGVTGTVVDPVAKVFAGASQLLENDDWAGDAPVLATAAQVGAFSLASATSKDAALVMNAASGSYTAQISGANPGTGAVLAEIYDATPTASFTATTPRLVNVSARAQVGPGNLLIAGFAISGATAKQILIRAIGPTLTSFNVPGVLANPKLELFAAGQTLPQVSNDDWGAVANPAEVAALSASVGAFPLLLESRDAVLLVSLPAGSYTAQVSGVNNTSGAAIVEVYEVP